MRILPAMRSTVIASFLWMNLTGAFAQNPPGEDLAAGFRSPPQAARARTWWHWMNGVVSKEGITADLEAMKRVGLAGAYSFNVDQLPIDDPSVKVLNPKWRELMKFSAQEASRLGLELGFHNSPGWSSSGGPWVKVEDSMQTLIFGAGEQFSGPGKCALKLASGRVALNYYRDVAVLAFPTVADNQPIPKASILDISGSMDAEGNLNWDAPAGQWTIVRFGHTTTGKTNGTAPVSGRGLEIDKFSTAALDRYWQEYPAKILADAGPLVGKTVTKVLIDSYEAGPQDWTPLMREEFKKRRGYDLTPWLVALTKRTVESNEQTQRFQRDWRQTISDLFVSNYYRHMAELAHRAGIQLAFEPYGTGAGANFDMLNAGGAGDILAGEFWSKPSTWGWDTLAPMVSAAHTWGVPIIGAESFTGFPQVAWQQDPYTVKTVGDRAWCVGVNQFILHTTAHQPWMNLAPGMTMGHWGMQFGRTQTWWDHGAKEWLDYCARAQYILQSGVYAADILFLESDKARPAIPLGYRGDTCGEDAFLSRATMKDGKITFPDGITYSVLCLPNRKTMTPALLAKVRQLVADGAIVIGPKPTASPSLENFPACDAEVAKLADEVWGSTTPASGEHALGKGKVIWGKPLTDVLPELGLQQDLSSRDLSADGAKLQWIHRRINGTDAYFISNQQQDKELQTEVSVRIKGMIPEWWRPDTGTMTQAAMWRQDGDRTLIPVRLDPSGSVFIVFRKPLGNADPIVAVQQAPTGAAMEVNVDDSGTVMVTSSNEGAYAFRTSSGRVLKAQVPAAPAAIEVQGPWELRFPPHWGAPDKVMLDKLISWPESPDAGVKYFSGTATYVKTVDLPADFPAPGRTIILNLGEVKQIAGVRINGKDLGVIWKPPFEMDVTSVLKAGSNSLEISVTNFWVNRLIGDEQQPEDAQWGGRGRGGAPTFPTTATAAAGARGPGGGVPLATIPDWLTHGQPRPSSGRYTFTSYKFYGKDSPLLSSGLLGPVKIELRQSEPAK